MLAPPSEIVIQPRSSRWRVDWRELTHYKDLLWLLVRRDFVAKYKQTILGPVWFVIQPLLTTVVFTIIFGSIAKVPTDGLPPVLFYLCGLLGWNYFAQTFASVSETFTSNANLFGKVYFPRLVIPASAAIGNIFALLLNFIIFIGFWCWFRFGTDDFTASIHLGALAAFPLIVCLSAGTALAFGLWMAVLTAKYRDLSHLTSFLVQLWLYATPVIYPLSQVGNSWKWLAALNPMTCVCEGLRMALLGTGQLTPTLVSISSGITILFLLSALVAFNHTERNFIDTV